MFADLRELPDGHVANCDLCIIGGGAAGISMAREFIGTTTKVCLIESAREYEDATQQLYAGVAQPARKRARSIKEGVHYGVPAIHSRLRHFGGSTNHWGGYCVPLDPEDLEKHDWIPDSGWPIGWRELSKIYPRAQAVCEIGPYVYDDSLWRRTKTEPYAFDPQNLVNRFYQFSPPTRFGDRYGKALKAAPNVTVLFNANVTNIGLAPNTASVDHIKVSSLVGKTGRVAARHYVLASGGIENARLLLASNDIAQRGIGNGRDLVGRYFMDHLYDSVGSLLVSENPKRLIAQYAEIVPDQAGHPLAKAGPDADSVMFQAALSPSAAAKKRNRAGAVALFIRGDWSRVDEGVRAVYEAVEREDSPAAENYGSSLLDILRNLDTAGPAVKNLVQGKSPPHLPVLFAIAEQVPNRASRIALADQKDALGMPRARIDWRLSELDRRTFAQMPDLLAGEFGRQGIGRVHKAPWLDEDALYLYRGDFSRILEPGRHHSGTTRMAHDPAQGVVDADFQIFGVSNLSVAGSSVFPTIGSANPTLTIIALALRLADHLKGRLTR